MAEPSPGGSSLPMFPLGTAVLPWTGVPLHVFEPRYRALVHDVLAGDRTFGTVLIQRGSEVGGDDVRGRLGALVSVREAAELPDGRWAVIGEGVARLRVDRWLDDDPYPRAEVTVLADPLGPEHVGELPALVERLRRLLALRTELGDAAAPATIELAPEPERAVWQVATLSGAGPLDLSNLLALDDGAALVARVGELVDEQLEVAVARLG